jgi:N-acetylglucosamine kinase-like BadF-type ATPase
MTEFVLAVDGGNVKTDLALLDSEGGLLALVRGGQSSPHYVGVQGCVDLLTGLLAQATAHAGLDGSRPAVAEIMVAGADLPEELAALRAALNALDWTDQLAVDNDTLALLRSGTDRGWGVAVVCGGGINAIGLAPDGREVRFPSLGAISGDWGGGYDIGLAGLMAAARSADGRGPQSVLERTVPAYFELEDPLALARALHLRKIAPERLGEVARVVFAAAHEDGPAGDIVARLADEVIAFATAVLRRLDLLDAKADVVLGGGLIRAAPESVIERIRAGLRDLDPSARAVVAPSAPIVGAALLGLDQLGASVGAVQRAREELHSAFLRVEGDGSRVSDGRTIAVGSNGEVMVRSFHG